MQSRLLLHERIECVHAGKGDCPFILNGDPDPFTVHQTTEN